MVGIIWEPADLANAVLYLAEGDWGNAALSGISAIPIAGDFIGKGGRGKKYLLKVADMTKLNQNKKVLKALDNIDIFIKARKADLGDIQKWIRRSWDEMLDGGGYVVEYVTPDGFIYKTRVSKDLRVHINLMDEAGDMLQETVRLGEKVGDGSELAGDVGKVVKGGGGAGFDIIKSTPELEAHIKYTDPTVPRKRGIGGAHNADEFLKNDIQIVSRKPHPEVNGVEIIEYQLSKLDKTGAPITGAYQSGKPFSKTIYDPKVISDESYINRGIEAANNALLTSTDGVLPRIWTGVDSQGVVWRGYYENGVITSFYPE